MIKVTLGTKRYQVTAKSPRESNQKIEKETIRFPTFPINIRVGQYPISKAYVSLSSKYEGNPICTEKRKQMKSVPFIHTKKKNLISFCFLV